MLTQPISLNKSGFNTLTLFKHAGNWVGLGASGGEWKKFTLAILDLRQKQISKSYVTGELQAHDLNDR